MVRLLDRRGLAALQILFGLVARVERAPAEIAVKEFAPLDPSVIAGRGCLGGLGRRIGRGTRRERQDREYGTSLDQFQQDGLGRSKRRTRWARWAEKYLTSRPAFHRGSIGGNALARGEILLGLKRGVRSGPAGIPIIELAVMHPHLVGSLDGILGFRPGAVGATGE
jgi:hypothetical protein